MVPMTYDLDLGFEAHQRISASVDHVMGASKGHVGAVRRLGIMQC